VALTGLSPELEERRGLHPQHGRRDAAGVVEAMLAVRVEQQRITAIQGVSLVSDAQLEAPGEHHHALLVGHVRIAFLAGSFARADHAVDDLQPPGCGRCQQVVL
jgi:hypothetical protein